MKFKNLRSALLLVILLAFAAPLRAQLMLNIETAEGTKQVSIDDIERIDFDESSVWALNFTDEAGITYSIPLQQHPTIRFYDTVAGIQWDSDDTPVIWIPSHHLLSNMSFVTKPSDVDAPDVEPAVRLNVDGNSLFISLGKHASVDVYAVDGRPVYSNPSASGDLHIPLQSGFFIVKINNRTFKIKR